MASRAATAVPLPSACIRVHLRFNLLACGPARRAPAAAPLDTPPCNYSLTIFLDQAYKPRHGNSPPSAPARPAAAATAARAPILPPAPHPHPRPPIPGG